MRITNLQSKGRRMINMAVKIGNSYVTEAAAAYAQSRIDEKSENVLSDLSKQFKDVNFGVNLIRIGFGYFFFGQATCQTCFFVVVEVQK